MKHAQSLSGLFVVESYKLTLVSPRGDSAQGLVTIEGKKLRPPSRRLIFHQKGLKINSAKITAYTKKGEQSIDIARINHHRKFEQVRLHTKETLYPGRYMVTMQFTVKPPASREKADTIKGAFASGGPVREFLPSIDEPKAVNAAKLQVSTE